jgi:hypothetical protein
MTRIHSLGESKSRGRLQLVLLAAAPLLLLPLALAACGGSGGAPAAHPTGKTEVVLQVALEGGFVTPETNLTRAPGFTLFGDGTVIVTGPMIEIYPQPALPNLQTTTISQEAIDEIVSAAQEAGLFANDVDYGQPGITDIPSTTITVNAGGQTYISNIYALGMEQGAGGLTMEQQQARAAITALSNQLFDLTAFQTGEVKWEPYAYTALAVYATPVDPSTAPDDAAVQPNQLDWPLGDLSTISKAVQPEGFRRVVVSGSDLKALQPLLSQATQITLWKSGATEYHLSFRPLLPNETN